MKNVIRALAVIILAVGLIARSVAQTATMSDITTRIDPQSDRKSVGGPGMQDIVFYSDHIKAVGAVTEVFGDGQRLTTAIVEYDTPIKNSSLSPTTFTVSGRNITCILI